MKAITVYREVQPNGDEFVSEYGNGWQRAYVITKKQLDHWKRQAKAARKTKKLVRSNKL